MKTDVLKSEWIPAASASKKLVVVLHGRGDSPAGFRWMPRALGFSDVNYLLLAAPDRYYTGYSWYDLPPDQGPGIIRSRRLIDKLIDEITAQGYRTEDAILFGFSQGCLMILEWAGRSEHRFAGLIGLSGYCYDAEKLAQEMSETARRAKWLITHGTIDETLPYELTEKHIQFLIKAGLPIEFKSYRKSHTIDDVDEIPMLRRWIAGAFELAKE